MNSGWLRALLRLPRGDGHKAARGFLAGLRRDVRGNTMAIGAAALIPLAGMVGGGIDMSRMYITKTRLQHACDAGTLAGRKSMAGGTWDSGDEDTAKRFFDANFQSGAYGSNTLTRSFSESGGTVSGNASAVLPMTLMRVLGKTTETIAVTCDAEMRLPNTDVMFVLDTTGSMDDIPSGDSRTKMASLKESVKCFYEIVARLDTDANCTTGTPSGGLAGQVQVRFGFVPYATNANVGRLLNTNWIADDWFYQTREKANNGGGWSDETAYSYHVRPTSGRNRNRCVAPDANTSTRKYTSYDYYYDGTWYCINYYSEKNQRWNYNRLSVDISGLKNGNGWNASFLAPIADDGGDKTITWDGCIEERATVRQASYNPIPSGAKDLDIDLVPSNSAGTRWGAVLPDLIYTRQSMPNGSGSWNRAAVNNVVEDYGNTSYYACPRPARKLQEWPSASDFDDYVDALYPEGNTYHDIGLLWGARLMSPTGIFASENATTPGGGEIERHMIFMTDGDACTAPDNYTAYGVQWFDRRQTDDNAAPTGGCTETGTLTQQVNARTEALCTAIKNKNITLWVITFGNLATTTETRMQNCATSGRYFKATNAATLQTTFKTIANQITQLRLTK